MSNAIIMERLIRMDSWITKRGTGTPEEFALKMKISRSTLMEYLALMRRYDAVIAYDKERKTYYYEIEGSFKIGFIKKDE